MTAPRPVLMTALPWVPQYVWLEDGSDGPEVHYAGARPMGDAAAQAFDPEEVLAAFLELAAGLDPVEVAAFVRRFGLPWATEDDRGVGVAVDAWWLVEGARAFHEAQRIGDLLRRNRSKPDEWCYVNLWPWAVAWDEPPNDDQLTVSQRDRQRLAEWLTSAMRAARVRPVVRWQPNQRPAVEYAAEGVLGILVLQLMRRLRAEDDRSWACASCGQPVTPSRSPKPGEPVYCREKACHQEQQRRNQRAHRARKRATDNEGNSHA